MRFKKTEVCQTCAKLKNVCQTCLLDLDYGKFEIKKKSLNRLKVNCCGNYKVEVNLACFLSWGRGQKQLQSFSATK